MKHIITLIAFAGLMACSPEKPTETTTTAVSQGADIQVPDSITQTFTLPDSINTGLIIATYVEIDPESHTLIMYANTDKKEAKRVRYLNNGAVTSDKLMVVSENVLRSADKKLEFTINDTLVVSKMANGQLLEHFRTDGTN